eukprot:1159156-Pelagomonas_calceolata.AAC.11
MSMPAAPPHASWAHALKCVHAFIDVNTSSIASSQQCSRHHACMARGGNPTEGQQVKQLAALPPSCPHCPHAFVYAPAVAVDAKPTEGHEVTDASGGLLLAVLCPDAQQLLLHWDSGCRRHTALCKSEFTAAIECFAMTGES